MFVTVVAVVCHLLVAKATIAADRDCTDEEERIEEVVTDTNLSPDLTFFGCQIQGQIGVADWKSKHPIYHSDRWRIGRIKCAPGHYEIKGRA